MVDVLHDEKGNWIIKDYRGDFAFKNRDKIFLGYKSHNRSQISILLVKRCMNCYLILLQKNINDNKDYIDKILKL